MIIKKIILKAIWKIKQRAASKLKTTWNYHKSDFPLIGNKNEGTYFDPYLLKCDDMLYMYASYRNNNSISLFKSSNYKDWVKIGDCLTPKFKWEQIINRGCVLKKDERYFMYYTGQYNQESKIGIAYSDDGINWIKKEEPILVPEFDFEKSNVMNPCVLYCNNMFYMWYSAGDFSEPDVICFASSNDSVIWNKHATPVLSKGKQKYNIFKVGGCDVHVWKGIFIMFYIGYVNIYSSCICACVSKNGIDWERIDRNPIVVPTVKKWDCHSVYKPAAYFDFENDILKIFYNGRNNRQESIGCCDIKLSDFLLEVKETIKVVNC